jgi:hypothetical protein
LLGSIQTPTGIPITNLTIPIALWSALGLPILSVIVGWIIGFFAALFYNLTSKLTKGIELYSE